MGRDKDKDKERGKDKERDKERDKDKEKDKERDRDRERDKEREKDKDKSKKKEKEKKDKKKDKDRDKDKGKSSHSSRHKRSRHHSSEGGSDDEKHKSHHSIKDKNYKHQDVIKRKRSTSLEPEDDSNVSKRVHMEDDESNATTTTTSSKGGVIELSIEETNKLRVQLGLKPLEVDEKKQKTDSEKETTEDTESTTEKKQDVHAPPTNIGEVKATEKLREKLETMKESRELAKKLATVRSLGDISDSVDEDTSAWVERMRDKEKEKKLAEERARLLEEMDGEFEGNNEDTKSVPKYSSQDLAGLTIEHKEDHFVEGKEVVLTLKDSKVLDEEDDVLVNVNMIDEEKGMRNTELRKNQPGYQPYEEEFDEYGNPITRSLLYKYDEEIEGQKINKFVLSESGMYNVSQLQKEKELARHTLEQKAVTLELPQLNIASEYYTNEEMVQFRKRRKIKKKDKFKVEDLVALDDAGKDHGSRKKEQQEEPMETDDIKPDPSLLDEADSKIETALQRTRRLLKQPKTSENSKGAAHVAAVLAVPKVTIKKEKVEEPVNTIILDTTAEFCRQIGEEDTFADTDKWQKFGDVTAERSMEFEEEKDKSGWTEIDPQNEDIPEKPDVLELEAKTHLTGVAAALQMATKKGFIETEKDKPVKRKGDSRTIIEGLGVKDWEYERDRGRERERDKDNHGREIAFCEKKGYIPEVNIEYVDNRGRLLTAKEAFQIMSHKFHGKGPGKKKTEKRLKREKEEVLLNKADAGDTPLQSLELLRKKQESSQSAYIVLTGQHQTMHMTELAKRK